MLGTLNVSQTGLNAAKILVENVSNNIANQNTEGYKKRVVQGVIMRNIYIYIYIYIQLSIHIAI